MSDHIYTDEDPEVLPATRETDMPADEYAERFVALHDAAGQHASAAVYCAAAAGAVAIQRKQALGWGKGFTEWKQNLVMPDGSTVSVRTIERYMALAKEMEERIKRLQADQSKTTCVSFLPEGGKSTLDRLASFDPSSIRDLHQQALAEAVREVSQEKSLSQLYFDWGIAKEPKRRGGDHGGGRAKAEATQAKMELERLAAVDQWRGVVSGLREFAARSRKVHIPERTLAEGIRSIRECLKKLED